MESKKAPKRKNLRLVKKDKTVDNRGAAKSVSPLATLTFTAESKDVLENHPKIMEITSVIKSKTEDFMKEIQELGNKHSIELRVIPAFDARNK